MLIYLAGPYTHQDPAVVEERYQEHRRECIGLMKAGVPVYSPIATGHTLLPELSGWKHSEWMDFDIKILKRCSHLMVLRLDGWKSSSGVQQEIGAALALGIPVSYVDPMPPGKERPVMLLPNGDVNLATHG